MCFSLSTQLSRLHALEGHHDEVKQELEKNIQALRSQIAKYDADYGKNLEVLNGLSGHLLNLLKNVRTVHITLCHVCIRARLTK